jgi:SAM-dependent methyltransferase
VTDPAGLSTYARLTFHGPLSAERADRLAAELAAGGPRTVADYGCGWGELLLDGRVTFIEGSAAEHAAPADIVLSCGAYHAFGAIPEALRELRPLVNPGGRLLFGAEIWEREPTRAQLAAMWPGTSAGDCLLLPDLVDATVSAGFRPLLIQTATRGEWEDFESGIAAGAEEWLLASPGHPEAEQVRERVDQNRSIWLRGHRDVLGFAYLILVRPD